MSNALAIAGVTAVLKDLLDTGLIEHEVQHAVGTSVKVSSMSPEKVPMEGTEGVPRINLFLHQVTPNAAYRNVDLPARSAPGQRTANPPLALDLHYLLTVYGFAELQAEVLLGYAMQMLHENPVLSRAQIRKALIPEPVSGAILPSIYQALRSADLAEQVEMLKITPNSLSTEEMSRLWSALQSHYRPTTAFQVSVVLIQPQRPAASPLPVLRRGALDQGVLVTPALVPPFPTLESVLAPAHGTPSVLRLGDSFELSGHHLGGTARVLVWRNDRFGIVHEIALPDSHNDTRITASLPGNAPALWPCGLYRVELRVLLPASLTPHTSNTLPVALAPTFTLPPVALTRDVKNVVHITLEVQPVVRAGQSVSLRMDSSESSTPVKTDKAQLSFAFADAPPGGGTPLLRLKVDGIDSVAIDRSTQPPSFFPHRITLPA